jgi:hypothetical protein
MNTQLSKVLNAHSDDNELRALSHAEQTQASGGKACYRSSGSNSDRYRAYLLAIIYERWSSSQRKYVRVNSFYPSSNTSFTQFCRDNGYNIFK